MYTLRGPRPSPGLGRLAHPLPTLPTPVAPGLARATPAARVRAPARPVQVVRFLHDYMYLIYYLYIAVYHRSLCNMLLYYSISSHIILYSILYDLYYNILPSQVGG